MESLRQKRTAEQIRTLLSQLLLLEMKDPRLAGLTVTRVSIDRELQYADVYVHALAEDEREPEVMDGLQSASGYLRREIGNHLRLRHAPVLHFHWDPSLAHAELINQLLDELDIPAEEE
ncbi:MAG: 30S ribosome-binding factor RbfA [Anaerolineae bacterium]|nr:30S ribosome-binding factor RbfA [Anaerolineae bacterium]